MPSRRGIPAERYSGGTLTGYPKYYLDGAKDEVEKITGLRPTNEKLLRGIRTPGVPPRLKDHMRRLSDGKSITVPFGTKSQVTPMGHPPRSAR